MWCFIRGDSNEFVIGCAPTATNQSHTSVHCGLKTYILNWYHVYNTPWRRLGHHEIGSPIFGELVLKMPADTHRVLKFHKD